MEDRKVRLQYSEKIAGSMVNVYAETTEELIELMGALANNVSTFKEHQEKISQVLMAGAAQQAVATPAATTGNAAQAASSGPPSGPSCQHGPRVYKTGTSAKGAWTAWFCPAPKGDPTQCKAEFK